jgi:regulatory protein
MVKQVTRLQFQKRNKERVNVYLDGVYAFAVPALVAARLRVGQPLSDVEIAALQDESAVEQAYQRAAHFLGVRPRSVAEVRRRLTEAEVAPAAIEAAITRLLEQGYLDDAAFARFWVENRQRFRPKGEQALRQELRRAGVAAETIQESLAELDTTEAAYSAARPQAERWKLLAQEDPAAFRQKLSAWLARRGFSYGEVREVVRRIVAEMQAED